MRVWMKQGGLSFRHSTRRILTTSFVLLSSSHFSHWLSLTSPSTKFVSAFPSLPLLLHTKYSFVSQSSIGRNKNSLQSSSSSSSSSSMSATRKRTSSKQTSVEVSPGVEFVEDHVPSWFRAERGRVIQKGEVDDGKCVMYWMIRDVRSVDNWALLYARHLASVRNQPLHVVYALPPPPSSSSEDDESLPPLQMNQHMTLRHGDFLLGGLQLVEKELNDKQIPFHVLQPSTTVPQSIHDICQQQQASTLVMDFSPLRHVGEWTKDLQQLHNQMPIYQVDAHNIVPVWYASPKREVGARTLRPKLHKLLPDFLTDYPALESNAHHDIQLPNNDWDQCRAYLQLDETVSSINDACPPGHKAAMDQFQSFLNRGLSKFDEKRNDPNYRHVCSNMSPYINHGHVSFQRLAWDVKHFKKHALGTAAFLEEGIVRRELSDNYVYYTPEDYDRLQGAAQWAQDSLQLHSTDQREYLYTTQQLQRGETHDDLWNASQHQLVQEGTLHGFLRMYWAKKILEWTESPAVALRTALYFNDRYALDGNDPNGFVGVGWSIMGIHDMGWKERPVFGKIRFMNYKGCQRKFSVSNFVNQYPQAKKNAAVSSSSTTKTKTTTTTDTKKRKRAK